MFSKLSWMSSNDNGLSWTYSLTSMAPYTLDMVFKKGLFLGIPDVSLIRALFNTSLTLNTLIPQTLYIKIRIKTGKLGSSHLISILLLNKQNVVIIP